tara:strand:+ start:226 stop:408 length:183 start_codon:yes stop_codon:yes gene_type:complete
MIENRSRQYIVTRLSVVLFGAISAVLVTRFGDQVPLAETVLGLLISMAAGLSLVQSLNRD